MTAVSEWRHRIPGTAAALGRYRSPPRGVQYLPVFKAKYSPKSGTFG